MFNGNELSEFFARTFAVILLIAFAAGAAITLVAVFGVPLAWELIKPILHEATR